MVQVFESKSQKDNPHFAIIVAGGSGTRMGSALPKQFLLLHGRPVIMHTINAFYRSVFQPGIIVVLHPDYHDYWRELCNIHQLTIAHTLSAGGETRFQSVKNGLNSIHHEHGIVAVHDAVRPLVSTEIIDNAYHQAAKSGNAVTAVKSRDSVRQQKGERSVSLLREDIYLVQTPQTFKMSQIKPAYEQQYLPGYTDDASVVEMLGKKINLVEGSYSNIKITFPEDLAIAELLLKK